MRDTVILIILAVRSLNQINPSNTPRNQINLSVAETRIFRERKVNATAADTLATCVARSSASMVLIK